MEYLLLALAAVAASTLTGTVGVGGALLLVPGLTAAAAVFGLLPADIRFTGYLMNFISLAPIVYKNRVAIDWKVARYLVGTAMLGAVIGANIPHMVSEQTLSLALTGVLLVIIALLLRKLYEHTPAQTDFPHTPRSWLLISAIGGVVGLASGLFGIGGGIFMLPLVSLSLGVKPQNIILMTPLIVLFSTGSGIASSLWHGMVFSNIPLTIIAVLGAMVGAEWGDKLRGKLSDRALTWVIIILLVLLTGKIFTQAT